MGWGGGAFRRPVGRLSGRDLLSRASNNASPEEVIINVRLLRRSRRSIFGGRAKTKTERILALVNMMTFMANHAHMHKHKDVCQSSSSRSTVDDIHLERPHEAAASLVLKAQTTRPPRGGGGGGVAIFLVFLGARATPAAAAAAAVAAKAPTAAAGTKKEPPTNSSSQKVDCGIAASAARLEARTHLLVKKKKE